jgi:hypothetical protein
MMICLQILWATTIVIGAIGSIGVRALQLAVSALGESAQGMQSSGQTPTIYLWSAQVSWISLRFAQCTIAHQTASGRHGVQ